jgi:hypothetical protein
MHFFFLPPPRSKVLPILARLRTLLLAPATAAVFMHVGNGVEFVIRPGI